MPKLVNHAERKQKIAEAAWRVIRRDGLHGVSVRRVAEEAGMSLGSLRYYFDSQDDLLAYAMRLLSERAEARIRGLPFNREPRHDIGLVIEELLPLDDVRLLEAEVWLAFAGTAVSNPVVRAITREVHDQLQDLFAQLIGLLAETGLAKEGIDPGLEAGRLHALVDGLVVHHTTCPDRLERERMRRIVSHHLDQLLRDE